jgi:hypothetical protein
VCALWFIVPTLFFKVKTCSFFIWELLEKFIKADCFWFVRHLIALFFAIGQATFLSYGLAKYAIILRPGAGVCSWPAAGTWCRSISGFSLVSVAAAGRIACTPGAGVCQSNLAPAPSLCQLVAVCCRLGRFV